MANIVFIYPPCSVARGRRLQQLAVPTSALMTPYAGPCGRCSAICVVGPYPASNQRHQQQAAAPPPLAAWPWLWTCVAMASMVGYRSALPGMQAG